MSNIRPYLSAVPQVHGSCYLDPLCLVAGDVVLAEEVSVWPFAVLRGDVNSIRVGKRSNIQDHVMLHVSHKTDGKPEGSPLLIGEDCTIGHHATLHGCTMGNRVLVGMGSIVLDDAVVEDDVMIGAGSLVPPRKRLKGGYLYVGSPVKQVRRLTAEELAFLPYSAAHYGRKGIGQRWRVDSYRGLTARRFQVASPAGYLKTPFS